MNQLSEAIRELYDRDLAQRLQQHWDDLDSLDQCLQRISARSQTNTELAGDPIQAAQIDNLIQIIGRQVDELILTRELNSRKVGSALSGP